MKMNTGSIAETISTLKSYFRDDIGNGNSFEAPYRSELYSSGQMARHAALVAGSHKLLKTNGTDQLLKRLDDNKKMLLEVRNLLVEQVRSGRIISPSAEWLLDNFYLIEEQIVLARKHLPKGYSEGLPNLAGGVSDGMPRVYDIVLEIIAHSDGRVDGTALGNFVKAYQTSAVLTLGELWAIPIMLRLAVIENLRRIAGQLTLDIAKITLADLWADKMLATVREEPGNLILVIADMARSKPELDSSFVASFTRKLNGKGPALSLPLSWMEQQLSDMGLNSNDLIRQENQKQAADQVSVRNSIGTLRFIGATDWREFVELHSHVEHVLRRDITGVYPRMDFATRDRYRHVVEAIAKRSALSETEVAQKALDQTEQTDGSTVIPERKRHIGYYLVDKGKPQTMKASAMRLSFRQRLADAAERKKEFLYMFSICFLAIAAAIGMIYFAYSYGITDKLHLVILSAILLLCSTQLAVPVVNWLATLWVRPQLLPRLDFSKGIPEECRTLVVVPTMLSSRSYIEELVEGLEIRFLANKEANLHFGLLTDFNDAGEKDMPGDGELMEFAAARIDALNEKYATSGYDVFYLFHRPREWNPKEKRWMGYERKRGKLAALNSLLRGGKQKHFSVTIGNIEILSEVKYVITLDSDTQLPRDAAWKFVATMAHPLNKAVYDPKKKRVSEGYGILQPRVASAIPKGATTLYLRMQGNVSGIDPYTRVSSDVYQDIFNEGSFIGKGIYDVDIFEEAVSNVFQENRILSHDLLEGCYARAGLLSDVLLYEENPSQYEADVRRHHRWIRGDWQIGAWMMPFVTGADGRLKENKLSLLSRWKIFDNLRRSLLPLFLLVLLLIGWTVLPSPWFWTAAVTIIILLPVMSAAFWQLIHKPLDLTLKAHLSEIGLSIRDALFRFVFGIAVLPYEALRYTDAILRTNWRMIVTRKHLLEWTTSASSSANKDQEDIRAVYLTMWVTPMLAIIITAVLLAGHPSALPVAAPFILLWLLAPAMAWYMNQPQVEKRPELREADLLFLHKSARKTWSFFEQFVTEEDNWLPPDNFQEQPVGVIAHRTSPTNMGLALLANLSAFDFGYISGGTFVKRSNQTLQAMQRLERYKGHFFNWYDTVTLSPLSPRYVSAVDSGNLAGHLLVLRQAFMAQPSQPVFTAQIFKGLDITARVVIDITGGWHQGALDKIIKLLQSAEVTSLRHIKLQLDDLSGLVRSMLEAEIDKSTASYNWINRLFMQIEELKSDISELAPWTDLFPAPVAFPEFEDADSVQSLLLMQEMQAYFQSCFVQHERGEHTEEDKEWLAKMKPAIDRGSSAARERLALLEQMAAQCELFSTVSYDFLFDKATSLLRIGFNVDEQRKDHSSYDLLASEARLGIFVAIAQGKLPQESWFSLGRLLTNSGGDPILLSWSGSMFEYLMPQLVMPMYENTLLHQTSKATVKRQIEYAEQHNVPWGISESAYNRVDAALNYQYRAFGVPGLGLKRGLEDDLVIAPYATMLALMISPIKACANMQAMSTEGFEGEHGFYEAIDYTSSRLPRGKTSSIVKSYMVHHQGMGLLSLAYLLLNKPMQQRFTSELRFQATLLLLQERVPRATLFYAHTADIIETHTTQDVVQVRNINTANTVVPEVLILSNGRYQVMITNSGGGYSRWKELAVTRWREDATKDDKGIFCYIKDIESGKFWSNTYHPTQQQANGYHAVFSQGHAEFRRHDHGIDTRTEIVISPEDDTEMRRVRLTNKTQTIKVMEVTSYAEIVMASQASDEAHPAFSNLFVQTEILPEYKSILSSRRPRSKEERPPWMFHLMDVRGSAVEAMSFETDRLAFIGRGRTLADPHAMELEALSGKQGAVLDPIMSIRYCITLKPNQTATIDLIYGISETREACETLVNKYRDQHLKNRAFELSWTHTQVLLRQINATETDAQLYDRLAASIIYNNPAARAAAPVIQSNYRGQSGLWAHSVSGDLPVVLLHIYDTENMELVRQLIQAHAYWRLKGLAVDLVIWNEDYGSYRQHLQEQILGLVTTEVAGNYTNSKPGNIFVKSADQLSSEDRILFESIARVIISDNKGSLSEQVNKLHAETVLPPLLEPGTRIPEQQFPLALPGNLLLFNGTGGFTPDGKEYKILTDANTITPAPWANVIANPEFGTVISESGSAYTWAVNAHEFRLTPWSNDPVSDAGGEAFYIRDEETAAFWSPSPFPAKGDTPYITTHGFGYTSFEHIEHGIASEMTVFVDKVLPVKFVVLRIKNQSGRARKCSATGFLEMILGDLRSKTGMHLLSELDKNSGALFFRNRYSPVFNERIAWFKANGSDQSFTTGRAEFIGRNRDLTDPEAMYREKLSGRSGAGMDTCAAWQIKFSLPPGGEKEVIFQIGSAENAHAAEALVARFADDDSVVQSLLQVKGFWRDALGVVQIDTPDNSLNCLANGWLVYQTMACRLFARSGLYQSGGAFGFRDQLQDVLALLHTRPQLAREQILLCASRQFLEGDVQHWWHPPEGRGVRTRCSDDMLWLPFAVCKYIAATGDKDILNVRVNFLESRALHHGEDSLFDLPIRSYTNESVYEHCARAIKYALRFGQHGLPLIGSGDWNDGMDRVGHEGKGESAWLAFFIYTILECFSTVATEYGDEVFADTCSKEALTLQSNIEMSAWDGQWYLRAYFDDGTALGSYENDECSIDAIVQSWSVLSGAGSEKRRNTAMVSLDKYLVKRDLKIIQLLDPPFDKSALNPGYIKGYVPGVRENGGQYSHAAIWALMAFAGLGDREKVWELFSMIQPLSHAADAAGVAVYKVEPYVMAADVYGNESHRGRGGWTWYTGSSGWMYQFIIGSLLGLELQTDKLKFKPCFPLDWPFVSISYRYKTSLYKIKVHQVTGDKASSWKTATDSGDGDTIQMVDDALEHEVEVYISEAKVV